MNTIILFWNPAVSSYTMERMREDMAHWTHVGNWSVWQHEAAKKGDCFIDAVNLDTDLETPWIYEMIFSLCIARPKTRGIMRRFVLYKSKTTEKDVKVKWCNHRAVGPLLFQHDDGTDGHAGFEFQLVQWSGDGVLLRQGKLVAINENQEVDIANILNERRPASGSARGIGGAWCGVQRSTERSDPWKARPPAGD